LKTLSQYQELLWKLQNLHK